VILTPPLVRIWLTPSPHADVRICIHNHTAATFIQVKAMLQQPHTVSSIEAVCGPVGRESLEMDGFWTTPLADAWAPCHRLSSHR